MPPDPNAYFDQAVLDQIEHSPIGAVPFTPTYQDALKRLYGSHQAYAHADHKNGHVTARSLAKLPHFQAKNLEELIAGRIGPTRWKPTGVFLTATCSHCPQRCGCGRKAFG